MARGSDPPPSGKLEALERFVVGNDDLLELEARLGRFNIFDALGVARAEIRHSNFLAFLLDPAESHGQGQLFLKAVLTDLLATAPPALRPLSPIELDGTDLRGVEVRREWQHLDLLIICRDPRFAVVVENKVDSAEHSDQLARYEAVMAAHHPGLPLLRVFLTPDGDEPSAEAWVPYTYADLYRVLRRARDRSQTAIGQEVRVFLDHYLNLLKARFMTDETLDELCRRIYKTHRQALDLIWERVGGPRAGALAEVLAVVEDDPRWHVLYRSGSYFDAVPKAWLDWLPPFGEGEDYPFCVSIRSRDTDLASAVWVGPMADAEKRAEVVTALRAQSPGIGFKRTTAYKTGDRYIRVTSAETLVELGEDEPDVAAVRAAASARLDALYTKLERLGAILRPLCSRPT